VVFDDGEVYANVQDFIKRFTRIWSDTKVTAAMTVIEATPILEEMFGVINTDVVFSAGNNIPTPPYPITGEGNRSGAITWFSKLYRGWRGSLRFKISAFTSQHSRLGVSFTPDRSANVPPQFNAQDMMGMVDPELYAVWHIPSTPGPPYQGFAPDFQSNYGQSCAPLAFSEGVNPSLFVEIPYASQYRYLMIQQDTVEEAPLELNDLSSIGTLAYSVSQIPLYQKQGPTSDNLIRPTQFTQINAFVSAGDEFRFGILLGPQFVYISSPATFPDTYTAT